MPESLKVFKVTGKCIFSSSEPILTSVSPEVLRWGRHIDTDTYSIVGRRPVVVDQITRMRVGGVVERRD